MTEHEIYMHIIENDSCVGVDCDKCPITDCSDPVRVALSMLDDVDVSADTAVFCTYCNGSGLGKFEASVCRECNGTGIEL